MVELDFLTRSRRKSSRNPDVPPQRFKASSGLIMAAGIIAMILVSAAVLLR